MPTTDDMRTAAEWLDQYEAQEDDENGAACAAVAEWIRTQAGAKDTRDAARAHGIPVASLRTRLQTA